MKKTQIFIMAAIVLSVFLTGCAQKGETVIGGEAGPAAQTSVEQAEIDADISNIDSIDAEFDLSELESLDSELAEIENLFS